MINTQEILSLTKDVRFSDWLENQPASRLCRGYLRNEQGQMCGVGILADFLGFSWNPEMEKGLWVRSFIVQKLGSFPFSPHEFDNIYELHGAEAAKRFVVRRCREMGL